MLGHFAMAFDGMLVHLCLIIGLWALSRGDKLLVASKHHNNLDQFAVYCLVSGKTIRKWFIHV
jgi:hypothetical protein